MAAIGGVGCIDCNFVVRIVAHIAGLDLRTVSYSIGRTAVVD